MFKENILHQKGLADKEVCESLPYLYSSKTYTPALLFFNSQEVYASHEVLELVTNSMTSWEACTSWELKNNKAAV